MKTIDCFIYALDEIRTLHPTIDVQHVIVICLIARSPGLTVGEIAKNVALPRATATRLMARIGHGDRTTDGLGLVEISQDPEDRRRYLCRLSENGEALISRVLKLLNGAKA